MLLKMLFFCQLVKILHMYKWFIKSERIKNLVNSIIVVLFVSPPFLVQKCPLNFRYFNVDRRF